jgi:hypothetical protein
MAAGLRRRYLTQRFLLATFGYRAFAAAAIVGTLGLVSPAAIRGLPDQDLISAYAEWHLPCGGGQRLTS